MPNSQYAYSQELGHTLSHVTRWLDLGCGHQLLPTWMDSEAVLSSLTNRYIVGIDLDRDALWKHQQLRLRIVGDVERLPIAAATFDLVTANMVIEHVHEPDLLFREVARVLRPGGSFLIHTPNAEGYTTRLTRCVPSAWRPRLAKLLQHRNEEDVYRTYYRANTLDALSRLAEAGSFRIARLRTVESSAQLFRVPGIGWLEERFLRMLTREAFWKWRPCIIGHLVKR